MHFTIEATPLGGVRVIPEIADIRLCRLEGENGIGKTLAMRMLELATGGQPYADSPAAWRSLRDHLGRTKITVRGLRDGSSLELTLDPEAWPETPSGDTVTLGKAKHNGVDIDFGVVPSILRVFRISGDERITERFANLIHSDRELVDRQNPVLADAATDVVLAAAAILDDLEDVSSDAYLNLLNRQSEAAVKRSAAATEFEQLQETLQRLTEFGQYVDAYEELRAQNPDIDSSLSEVERRLTDLSRIRGPLEQRQKELAPSAERLDRLLAELQQLTTQWEQRTSEAKDAAARIERERSRLGLTGDSEDLDRALTDVTARSAELEARGATLSRAPHLLVLISQLRSPLDAVRESDIDLEKVAAVNGTVISPSGLRTGLDERRSELLSSDKPLLEEINAELASVTRELTTLRTVERLQAESLRRVRAQERAEKALVTHREKLPKKGNAEYDELLNSLDDLLDQERSLIERRVELRGIRKALERFGSEPELAERINTLRSELAVEGTPAQALAQVAAQLEVSREALLRNDQALQLVTTECIEYEARVDSIVGLLEKSDSYDWLRSELGDALPRRSDTRLEALSRIGSLAAALEKLKAVANQIPKETAAMHQALGAVQGAIGKGALLPLGYNERVAAHYGRHFSDLLADHQIQAALFPGGRFIEFDLIGGTVTWQVPGEDPITRPLEAFSSGERAFAYVLASILQVRDLWSQNRLLVLDEFGAFVAEDRLSRLVEFLHEQVLTESGMQQVVIILPLRKPPQPDSPEADQIAARGYFMRDETGEEAE